jgi:hypothetical protein
MTSMAVAAMMNVRFTVPPKSTLYESSRVPAMSNLSYSLPDCALGSGSVVRISTRPRPSRSAHCEFVSERYTRTAIEIGCLHFFGLRLLN